MAFAGPSGAPKSGKVAVKGGKLPDTAGTSFLVPIGGVTLLVASGLLGLAASAATYKESL
jgi:hypothetical protein